MFENPSLRPQYSVPFVRRRILSLQLPAASGLSASWPGVTITLWEVAFQLKYKREEA